MKKGWRSEERRMMEVKEQGGEMTRREIEKGG